MFVHRISVLLVALTLALTGGSAFAAVEWRNLDDAHRRGGRRVSQGYLQGKVVMVCRSEAQHQRMASLWESLKTKAFVLVGAYAKAPEGAGYPVYFDADLRRGGPDADLYVVDETGKVIFFGADDRMAMQVAVTALTDLDSPRDVKQWKRFLDYELENLPAHAYNRLKAFSRLYPEEANAYREKAKELVKVAEVRNAAEFLSFAKMAKDPRSFAQHESGKQEVYEKMLESALTGPKYLSLKERVKDERMLQEVKNAFADLKWTQAEL